MFCKAYFRDLQQPTINKQSTKNILIKPRLKLINTSTISNKKKVFLNVKCIQLKELIRKCVSVDQFQNN